MVNQIEQLTRVLATLPPVPAGATAALIAAGNTILPTLIPLKSRLSSLQSNKTFTE